MKEKQISISFTVKVEEDFLSSIAYEEFVYQLESFLENFGYFSINNLKIEVNEL